LSGRLARLQLVGNRKPGHSIGKEAAMTTTISPLAEVHSQARLGHDVHIGPFCIVGPHVSIGDGTKLYSHVVITGHTTVGEQNRFYPGCVVGGEPQDVSFRDSDTFVVIGDNNIFREGVTVSRGAEKEDHTTRIGSRNMFMANSHVAHNCHVFNNVILVNGVLLGGHVHVHDGAIVSGNSAVHHYSTLGTLCFVSGGCRVPHDVPPYMLAAGSDNPTVCTINIVGMQRNGVSREAIAVIKQAHRLLYRECKGLATTREYFHDSLDGIFPFELTTLLNFVELQQRGKLGRARETLRDQPAKVPQQGHTPHQDVHRRRAA
jgi:UDP-N-acetylglucosamine acyltransferase